MKKYGKQDQRRMATWAVGCVEREAKGNSPACFAARSVGQAVATAHVPQHAFGGAYYALKAVAAADLVHTWSDVVEERDWQLQHISKSLRGEIGEGSDSKTR